MYRIKKLRKRVKLLRSPRGLARIFLQAIIGDGLLCRLQVALLLVIIEDAGRGVEIVRIARQRGVRLVKKLAQAARLTHKIEIVFDQLRRPQWLEILFVDRQALFHRSLIVSQQGPCLGGKCFIIWKLGAIFRNQVGCSLEVFLLEQKFKVAAVEPCLLWIANDPRIVLLDRRVLSQRLRLDYLKGPLKRLPRALVRDGRESF